MADSGDAKPLVTQDPWTALRRFTPARIALGRAGASQPTGASLSFALAHAQARDAVHEALDIVDLLAQLRAQRFQAAVVRSCAPDRETYLRRPDLGRRLDEAHCDTVRALTGSVGADSSSDSFPDPSFDLAFVLGDGLSPIAVQRHAVPVLTGVRALLGGWRIAPVVVAEQARVALADEVGQLLGAGIVAILIGERPGLSSPDSMGIYLTFAPRVGCTDAQRNCISNIRPQGLGYEAAASRLAHLLNGARRLGATGIALKDDSAAGGVLT